MKKKMEAFAKTLNANEKKKLTGGVRLYCEPVGSYHGTAGFGCCTGCFDGNYVCIMCMPPLGRGAID